MRKIIGLAVIAVLAFSAIGFSGCEKGTSQEEQNFIDAVNDLGEINADSYQAIKDAYDLYNEIETDRQKEIEENSEESFMTLKQANVQLYDVLANELYYPFDEYLSTNSSVWSSFDIEGNIPEDVLIAYCENEENRDALSKIHEVDDWLTDNMSRRFWLEFRYQRNEESVVKVENCSAVIDYWGDHESKSSTSTSNSHESTSSTSTSSSNDDWAEEYLEEQFGTSDPDEVDTILEGYKRRGDDFYDRYGYYPEG